MKLQYANGSTTVEDIKNSTQGADGFMSKEDKVKLDGISYGANNYTLPTASANTLGGIKTGYNNTADASKWAVKVDNNGNAFVPISGLYHDVNNYVSSLIVGSPDNGVSASYNAAAIVFSSQGHGDYSCDFPKRGGTFALTSDLSDLCKFNFINSISECKNGKINFLFNDSGDVDLSFIDNLEGVILFITSKSDNYIIHSTGRWYSNMYLRDKGERTHLSKGDFFAATVYNR